MRIASMVPSATEYLFALGLGDEVVAVTHECDFPEEATELPQLTASVLESGLAPGEIDDAVRERVARGESLYVLDEELLSEVEPDLIVAQQLCDVCAVSFDELSAVADRLPSRPRVISLDPTTLGEVLGDVRTIAQAVDELRILNGDTDIEDGGMATTKDAGVELVGELADRIDAAKIALKDVGRPDGPDRVRVAALEWLDPPYIAGHWVPQMIDLAGGTDFLGLPGERSFETNWETINSSEPEAIILMQCGYDASLGALEATDHAQQLIATGAQRIYACNASAYFSRPGPRLVDGLEQLAHALHPSLIGEPESGRMLEVDLA